MTGAEKILAAARSQLGVTEQPPGSNRVKYNDWYYGRPVSGPSYPWCMAFVQWVFCTAGMAIPLKTASCGMLMAWARRQKKFVRWGFRPGDVVFFRFDGRHVTHTGIVEKIRPDGYLVTIEGNTGVGNDANGGAVMRRVRNPKTAAGAYRM